MHAMVLCCSFYCFNTSELVEYHFNDTWLSQNLYQLSPKALSFSAWWRKRIGVFLENDHWIFEMVYVGLCVCTFNSAVQWLRYAVGTRLWLSMLSYKSVRGVTKRCVLFAYKLSVYLLLPIVKFFMHVH